MKQIAVALLGACCSLRCTTGANGDYARGQSGSEVVANGGSGGNGGEQVPGGDTVPCPCSYPATFDADASVPGSRTWAMLRVTLLARDVGAAQSDTWSWCHAGGPPAPGCGRVTLRVEQTLFGDVGLEPGDEIDADTDGILPCYAGTESVPVGAEAFAQLSWPPPAAPGCAAPQQCFDAEQTIATRGSARLTLWGETIVFADNGSAQVRVPPDELGQLWGDFNQCKARYGDWASLPGGSQDVSGI